MSDLPPFLVQQEPRLSVKEGEKIVDDLLKKLNIRISSNNKNHQLIIRNQGSENEETKKYFELVQQVRVNGICGFIQTDLDRTDIVFGGTFGLSTPNWQMKLTTEWAGYRKELKGPCRNIPSEIDISEDIEFYKEETCLESSNHDFDMCCRNYRGYLFSTIALIDSYINRHIVLFDFNGLKSTKFIELKDSKNTEHRIELFVDLFCSFTFAELKQTKAWDDFKKLKNLRNEIVHSLNPYMGIEIEEMAANLNLSIHGVGSLLKQLQDGQGRFSLGFIERVRTSPVIHYNQVTLRADGQHIEKKHFNKISR